MVNHLVKKVLQGGGVLGNHAKSGDGFGLDELLDSLSKNSSAEENAWLGAPVALRQLGSNLVKKE
jgi:hypothetical protein